ncbi:hypothetical protein [Micromonospora sp. NPDC049282]|uniref:hypothetical protein n=1 Tax=Micromonospora sp. NPDC049282 TaxID=3364269 RepID=UPI0037153B7C
MTGAREPWDLAAYQRRARFGRCFVCAYLAGDPDFAREPLHDDGAHVAFLNRYPALVGSALVAARRHVEDVVGGSTREPEARFRGGLTA